MKFTSEIKLTKAREEIIGKFKDPENMKHWQRGFISMETISGILGKKGSKSRLKYKIGNQEIEMEETIVNNDLPGQFHANYQAKGVYNIQENFFEETLDGDTLWTSNNEFRFSGFMKLMGLFMPTAFRKQSSQYINDFKAFAENDQSVLNVK